MGIPQKFEMCAIEGMDRAIKCHRHHRHCMISMAATGPKLILKWLKTGPTFSHSCARGMPQSEFLRNLKCAP